MEGSGAYNRSSSVQASGLSPAVPLLEQAAQSVPLADAPAPVVIADYGASEGRNSLAPMAAAIACLRTRTGPDRAISVVHTDLPGNDFNALFQVLAGDPNSYLHGNPAVFAYGVGRSFYEQILPAESVTLGWSSWAVQWLSRIPGPIPDQIQVAFSKNAAAHAAYTGQAAQDWRDFLRCRARELRRGGRLVVLTMALDEHGQFGYRAVVGAIYDGLLRLADEGVIRPDEVRRMAIPTVGRSRADLLAPFADGRFADLAVEHVDVFDSEDHIFEDFQRDRDARGYAARWAAFSRASVFPTLALGLDGGVQDARASAFYDKLEATMTAMLAVRPERELIPLARMVLVKTGG